MRLAGLQGREVLWSELLEPDRARLEIVQESDAREAELARDRARLERPGQVRALDASLLDRAGDAEARRTDREVGLLAQAAQDLCQAGVLARRVGLAPEVRERLFERGVSTKGKPPEHGIGLFTAKGVIESLGGTISICSPSVGMSCSFRVTVPRNKE